MLKQRKTKLQLNRETMRVLESKELNSIVGGCGCAMDDYISDTDCSYCASFTC